MADGPCKETRYRSTVQQGGPLAASEAEGRIAAKMMEPHVKRWGCWHLQQQSSQNCFVIDMLRVTTPQTRHQVVCRSTFEHMASKPTAPRSRFCPSYGNEPRINIAKLEASPGGMPWNDQPWQMRWHGSSTSLRHIGIASKCTGSML